MSHTVSKRISDEILNCGIQIESNGKVDARPYLKSGKLASSALGLAQFLNATWRGTIKAHRPDLMQEYSDEELLKLRVNPSLSISMMARLWEDQQKMMGSKATPGDLYLAHFLGPGTAKRVLYAPSDADVEPIAGASAVKANPTILRGRTCGWVRDWATAKMNKAKGHDWIGKYYDPNDPLLSDDHHVDEDSEDIAPRKIERDDDVTRPDDGIARSDTTPHGETNDQIANVQRALLGMGYIEVGLVDGTWGGATAGSIKMFLNDRGLDDWKADMSQRVIDEIARVHLSGWKRDIAPERKNTTSKELAERNTTMRSTLRTKKLGLWGMISGVFMAVVNAVTTYFHQAWDMIAPLRNILGHVPIIVWVILFVGVCIFLYKNAANAEEDQTEAFQSRRLLR